MPAIGGQPERPEIVFFGNAVAPTVFKLQPELLPAEAPHRHRQAARATKLREVISGVKG